MFVLDEKMTGETLEKRSDKRKLREEREERGEKEEREKINFQTKSIFGKKNYIANIFSKPARPIL